MVINTSANFPVKMKGVLRDSWMRWHGAFLHQKYAHLFIEHKVAKFVEVMLIKETNSCYERRVVRIFPNGINPLKIRGNKC